MNKKVVDLAKKHAMLTERNASYMLFENLRSALDASR